MSEKGTSVRDESLTHDPGEVAREAAAFAVEQVRREEYDAAGRKPCSAARMAARISKLTENGEPPPEPGPRPKWLRVKAVKGGNWRTMLKNLGGLHTVCREANCPNIGECWNRGTATFMILGDTCTRSCGFCNVKMGKVDEVDHSEPEKLAESVVRLGLKHVVITSVNRDNLADGGAGVFAECIRLVRALSPGTTIEVLTPDFLGDLDAIKIVMDERPEVFNHNVETVPRLYRPVRPQARYERSLLVLREAKKMFPEGLTKSGLMLGLGEEMSEVVELLKDLRTEGVNLVTIGQYLQPNKYMLPVVRYVTPEEFDELGGIARGLGFTGVASGPLVRSSYHAESMLTQRT